MLKNEIRLLVGTYYSINILILCHAAETHILLNTILLYYKKKTYHFNYILPKSKVESKSQKWS